MSQRSSWSLKMREMEPMTKMPMATDTPRTSMTCDLEMMEISMTLRKRKTRTPMMRLVMAVMSQLFMTSKSTGFLT